MAAISPGTEDGVWRKPKKPTATTKAHRFESFTKRIARIKIDPVHKVENHVLAAERSDLSNSYFRIALDEWAELNLSQTFTSFLNKVNPLSENLPQILHHADQIFELLTQHIEKKDALALEPLFSLLAHLAHDLGYTFEKYFARTVNTVVITAASHENADVIEWAFTCLSWLFKYLSRLLVQDLRPLLQIMMPFLSSRKAYIERFSAESLAFLLRKAAGIYKKQHSPLTLSLAFLFEWTNNREVDQTGVMTLLVETALGTEGRLHSSAPSLVEAAIIATEATASQKADQTILEGFLIGVIHRTDRSGFSPILQTALDFVGSCEANSESRRIRLAVTMLQAVVGTRKGSRISDWKATTNALIRLCTVAVEQSAPREVHQNLLCANAMALQYGALDQMLPLLEQLLHHPVDKSLPSEFFAYCELVADLGRERFQSLLLPKLQQYIVLHWADDESGLLYLLQDLHMKNSICPEPGKPGHLSCPQGWEDRILKNVSKESLMPGTLVDSLLAGYTRLNGYIQFPLILESRSTFRESLRKLVTNGMKNIPSDLDLRTKLSLGWVFETYMCLTSENSPEPGLWNAVVNMPPSIFRLEPFLRSCKMLLDVQPVFEDVFAQKIDSYRNFLTENLLTNSIGLREVSLSLLKGLGNSDIHVWLSETIELVQEILSIPYHPSNVRQIAMLLRKLPQHQRHAPRKSVMAKIIPYFCLGLLPEYFDALRRDLCIAIGQIVQDGIVIDEIFDIIMTWLRNPAHQPVHQSSISSGTKSTSFQCTNLTQVLQISSQSFDNFAHPEQRSRVLVEQAHRLELARIPSSGRSLALQILSEVPEVAEKRSRQLIPVFLAAQFGRVQHDNLDSVDQSVSSQTLSPDILDHDWALADRKAFLSLLGKFQNPRVLFRAAEVHDKLLELMSNGNQDIRKLSLAAILTWKDPIVQPYATLLMQIAEEKKVNADIGITLNAESASSPLKISDRPVVLPLLLRLLFGQLVGRSGTYGSQEARRKSILRMLFRMRESEVVLFLQISLGGLREINLSGETSNNTALNRDIVPVDQQYGFLRMMLSMLETLQSQFTPYGNNVVEAILYCTLRSAKQIENENASLNSIHRNIRRSGLQCLISLFTHCPDIVWERYMSDLFLEVISPKVEDFAVETAQGISMLHRLFSTWCRSHRLVSFLSKYDSRLWTAIWDCLTVSSGKAEVKIFVLDQIAIPLANLALDRSVCPNPAFGVVRAEANTLLLRLSTLLRDTPPRDILSSVTTLLPSLATFAESSSAKNSVLNLLVTILGSPKFKLPPVVKASLLGAINSLIPKDGEDVIAETETKLYILISSFFDYFKDQQNRLTLCDILQKLSRDKQDLLSSSSLCLDLNAFSRDRLDEVDYDCRLQAFQRLSDLQLSDETSASWLPILYNLLYFARDEDFAIRANAVASIKVFISRGCSSGNPKVEAMVEDVLLAEVQKRITEDSEVVRAEFVNLLGLLIGSLESATELADMRVLLVGNDDEASFFSNILHIQQHRRLRAIRRLLTEVEQGHVTSSNVARIFIPLLQKFVLEKNENESNQSVRGQSILAMNTLLQWIEWKQFKVIFRQFRNDLQTDEENEKNTIKLLGYAADALEKAWSENHQTSIQLTDRPKSHLAATLPADNIICNELKVHFIPKLADFVHYKDETQMSFRLPAAVTSIKLIKMLPAVELQLLSAPIVLDVAQILRSRTQETRNAARAILAEMVALLGPSSVQFVLKELRNVLTRGYQLHVLSFTLHTIMISLSKSASLGELDYCLGDIVTVIMDDIFGVVGQEKENQDYISSMKEVKSSKSFDSMELLARSTGVSHLMLLIRPIQALLSGDLATKQVRKVDELLRRIGVGLAQNPVAGTQDLLIFAYQVIKEFYREKPAQQPRSLTNEEQNKQRFLLQLSNPNKSGTSSSSSLSFKIAKFAIDLVRSILIKHDDLLKPENVHGFLPIIGDALVEGQEDVKISAMRLASAIVKLKMQDLDESAPLYVIEAVKVVMNCTNTNEEAAQAALKLVAAILRERRSVQIRDSDIADLLHRISPDLEEPDRQGVTFNFIKAVMVRKYQLPQVYELADKIGIMMVTNHSRGARDTARGVYVHFVLEYPQSSNRWSKQQKFLMKNLEYDHPEGRQSIMEAINTLLSKTSGDMTQQIVSTFFVPIMLRMANDDNETCRELAGALLAQIFRKADRSHLRTVLEPLRAWIEQSENLALTKLSMQAYSVLFDLETDGLDVEVDHVLVSIGGALRSPTVNDDDDWEMRYHALQLLAKLADSHPATVFSKNQESMWTSIRDLLNHSHAWIQIAVVTLIGKFFQTCGSNDLGKLPLTSSNGLRWDGTMLVETLRRSIGTIRRNETNPELSTLVVPNLFFLGRCIDSNKLTMKVKANPIWPNGSTQEERLSADEVGKSSDNGSESGDLDEQSNPSSEGAAVSKTSIPAIQYLLNQCAQILRRETPRPTALSLLPKQSILDLLIALIPHLSTTSLPDTTVVSLLLPLHHTVDPASDTKHPHSSAVGDTTLKDANQNLITKSHEVMELIQSRLGDAEYVKVMTQVAQRMRRRREERRTKRRIEKVAEPEKAALLKKRKMERKRDRKREVVRGHVKRRREW